MEHVVADLGADVGALDEIQRARDDPQVDPFLRGTALDVVDVARERDQESLPRAVRVDGSQSAGVGDVAQRGPVRGPSVVVIDRPAGVSAAYW